MLRFLQRLLGWDSHPASSKPEGMERRQTPRTSAASVIAEAPPQAAEAPPQAADAPPQAAEDPHAGKVNKSTEVEKLELSLQDSELNREKSAKVGSNPYDTGKFNRPNVWSNAGGRKNN